jgi:molecular chaperone GrpE (heat shock protein)
MNTNSGFKNNDDENQDSSVTGKETLSENNNPNVSFKYSNTEEELKQQIEELQASLKEVNDKVLRRSADIINLKNQFEIDLTGVRKEEKKYNARAMLSLLNDFNLAFQYKPTTNDESVNKFINTLEKSFEKTIIEFEKKQIKILIPKVGDDFDPVLMMALNQSNNNSEVKVTQVVGLGLQVEGQVINPATVLV